MANRRKLEVLNVLDAAKTQRYHFKVFIIVGMGFFTNTYELFSISVVTKILGRLYYTEPVNPTRPGILSLNVSFAITSVALCGTFAGQLFFGWLGDKMGRKRVYALTLIMMSCLSLASGLSFGHTAKGVITALCFIRFWLGFSIGGTYTLSATIMSEYANKKTRGTFIAAVFAMQSVAIMVSGVVSLIVSAAFDSKFNLPSFEEDPIGSLPRECDYIWRIILMFGALPAGLSYLFCLQMPETARYTALVAHNAKQAAEDMSKLLHASLDAQEENLAKLVKDKKQKIGLFSKEFAQLYGLRLLGTTGAWFLLSIVYSSSQNILMRDIFIYAEWIPTARKMSAIREVYIVARAQTLITLCGVVPGYWFTVAFIDVFGRRIIQFVGFLKMTVFLFVIASRYEYLIQGNYIRLVVLYGFTFFFANFGPNVTTYIVPAEIFPARLRSTCHGISAAAGRVGSAVGAFGISYLSQDKDPARRSKDFPPGIGIRNTLFVLCAINFVAMFFTFLVPEAKGKSLEEVSAEDQEAAYYEGGRFSVL